MSDRSIGVSNFNIKELEHLFKIARVKPAVNQISFHPYNWAENRALLGFHQKHGIVTEAYSSLSYAQQKKFNLFFPLMTGLFYLDP